MKFSKLNSRPNNDLILLKTTNLFASKWQLGLLLYYEAMFVIKIVLTVRQRVLLPFAYIEYFRWQDEYDLLFKTV